MVDEDRLRSVIGPPCPQCQSTTTVLVDRRFGTDTFFCGDCQHSWEVKANSPHVVRRDEDALS